MCTLVMSMKKKINSNMVRRDYTRQMTMTITLLKNIQKEKQEHLDCFMSLLRLKERSLSLGTTRQVAESRFQWALTTMRTYWMTRTTLTLDNFWVGGYREWDLQKTLNSRRTKKNLVRVLQVLQVALLSRPISWTKSCRVASTLALTPIWQVPQR